MNDRIYIIRIKELPNFLFEVLRKLDECSLPKGLPNPGKKREKKATDIERKFSNKNIKGKREDWKAWGENTRKKDQALAVSPILPFIFLFVPLQERCDYFFSAEEKPRH
ncbi:hypothetical protein NPIL_250111 [Nephila pilipes]|uniref:Uncharacterized protein n=1 Tax=Nephila pilipes TaxID=299642 RepID=A0A8X6THN6_NEPPI|nr:hypothetical protein NPIL_250111 [Nephila pilipes]